MTPSSLSGMKEFLYAKMWNVETMGYYYNPHLRKEIDYGRDLGNSGEG
jgi:hypothetical protein